VVELGIRVVSDLDLIGNSLLMGEILPWLTLEQRAVDGRAKETHWGVQRLTSGSAPQQAR